MDKGHQGAIPTRKMPPRDTASPEAVQSGAGAALGRADELPGSLTRILGEAEKWLHSARSHRWHAMSLSRLLLGPLRSGRGPVGVGLPIGLVSCSLAGRLCSVSGDGVKERGRGAHCLGHLAHLLSQSLSKGLQGTSSFGPGLVTGRAMVSDLPQVECPAPRTGEAGAPSALGSTACPEAWLLCSEQPYYLLSKLGYFYQ